MAAMHDNAGEYIVVVDGSVPVKDGGVYSTIAGISNLAMLEETVKDAFAVIAVGSCAAFGGIPGAQPNPTGAVAISELVTDKPVINISGCPPIPEAMTGTLAYLLSFGAIPELDHLGGPGPSSASRSTTAATGGRSTSAACSPPASTTRARARAGACSSSAARARSPTTPAPP
jgi:NiFe hydrogenase small subunit HydA